MFEIYMGNYQGIYPSFQHQCKYLKYKNNGIQHYNIQNFANIFPKLNIYGEFSRHTRKF